MLSSLPLSNSCNPRVCFLATMAAHRDLLYVASRVRSPPKISVDDFHAWYDSVHVPDVLKTSAVSTAYRYNAATDTTPWPFLAIYPVHDLPQFVKGEYASIPSTSDLLPGPTHSCFDVAQFDIRGYRPVASGGESDILAGKLQSSRERSAFNLTMPRVVQTQPATS